MIWLLLAALAPAELAVLPAHIAAGELLVIEVRGAGPEDQIEGTLAEQPLLFFTDEAGRRRALAAAPLAPGEPLSLKVALWPPDGRPREIEQRVTIRPRQFEERTLKVARGFVHPNPEARERMARERAALEEVLAAPPSERAWSGSFARPCKGRVTSTFGQRRLFNGALRSQHTGLDLDGPEGRPVRAIGAGRAVLVADRYASGGTVIVDHGLGLFSFYFHLKATLVEEGQPVERGQVIGQIGKTGRATGPHLHLGVQVGGQPLDPESLLGFDFAPKSPR